MARLTENISFGRRAALLIVAGVLIPTLAVIFIDHFEKLVIYNPTQSVPTGFYRYAGKEVMPGAIVLLRTPEAVREYTSRYYGSQKPMKYFLKPVLAAGGDKVCYRDGRFLLNGEEFAGVESIDSNGNPLPVWKECRVLEEDEIFVYSDRVRNSFDSRYYGPVKKSRIVGAFVKILGQ